MRRLLLPLLFPALLLGPGCQETKASHRYSQQQAASTLAQVEKVGLALGEFTIDGSAGVVDGDTVRVRGLKSTLRLLAIDTEETFKHEQERSLFARGWEKYKQELRGESPRPVKMATPLGEEAKRWAQEFFRGVNRVRLERDHPGEIRDHFGRYLAYLFVEREGRWVSFNVECVRSGMSPYFVKYGRSRRFHQEFLQAQAQAQAAQRGIWDPSKQHYDDYPERLAWWAEREQAVLRFEQEMESHPEYVSLTRSSALLKLEERLGKEVVVLGAVTSVRLGDRGPTVVRLGRPGGDDFEVVFFDKDVALSSGVMQKRGEFVRIRGVVSKFRSRGRNAERLQLVVNLPGQVLLPDRGADLPLPESPAPSPGRAEEPD